MRANARVQCDGVAWGLVETPLGRVGLGWRGDVVTAVVLEPELDLEPEPAANVFQARSPAGRLMSRRSFSLPSETPPVLPPDWLLREILAYCRQPHFRFSVLTEPAGTPFQRRVWRAISAIPVGCTRTYSEVAAELGSSPRAVGGACRANPYPLLVPCHRVVALNGLGGFSGDTKGRLLAFKRRLLAHEGARSA